MNRNRLTYMVVSIIVVVALFVFFINSPEGNENEDPTNTEPAYSTNKWNSPFDLGNKKPYGLYVFEELLIADGRFTQFNEYTDYTLLDSLITLDSSIFMYIGEKFTLTDEEVDKLLFSISDGNQFFLSVEEIPTYLYTRLFDNYPLLFQPADSVVLNTDDGEYAMYSVFENDTLTGIWNMFKPSVLDSADIVHTRIFKRPNYIEISYGHGSILLHLNPIYFTNYQMLREDGKEYFKFLVNTLNQPHIQWLAFAKYKPFEIDKNMSDTPADQSLLSELFRYPPFKWAFIIAVFGLILYFFFRSKRERPVIPAFSKSKNSGYAFVDTLAGIYYQGNHAPKILKLMRRNFYDAVYRKFYIDLSKRKSNKPIIALSQKSGINQSRIEGLLKNLETKMDISDLYVSKTYQLQRDFYLQSGIWSTKEKGWLDKQFTVLHRSVNQAWSLVISGILLILFGFTLLSSTVAWGVLLWPLGIAVLGIGARMLGHPIIKINNREFIYQPLFGSSQSIELTQIDKIERNGDLIKIILKNNKLLTINLQNVGEKYRQRLIELKTILNNDNYGG